MQSLSITPITNGFLVSYYEGRQNGLRGRNAYRQLAFTTKEDVITWMNDNLERVNPDQEGDEYAAGFGEAVQQF